MNKIDKTEEDELKKEASSSFYLLLFRSVYDLFSSFRQNQLDIYNPRTYPRLVPDAKIIARASYFISWIGNRGVKKQREDSA